MTAIRVLFLTILIFPLTAFSPKNAYEQSFGDAYQHAIDFCKKERKQFLQTASKYQLDSKLMAAVVFPELMRYDAFKNFFETQALELAYVEQGSKLADFSIGQFQMKPSFAEFIEARANEDDESDWAKDFQELCSYPAGDLDVQRKERLNRLKNTNWQLLYLAAFIKYSQSDLNAMEQQLPLIASRYNCGPQKSWEEVKLWLDKKTFPYGLNYEGSQFNYAEISLHFYQNIAPKIIH
jgi:hypothetical protein